MTEFWTTFIWGLGISCGAAIGFIAFLFAKAGVDLVLGRTKQIALNVEFNRQALYALTERNELARQMINCLGRIGNVIEERGRSTLIGDNVLTDISTPDEEGV